MKIYNYHPETGVFVNASIADESPLEPGQWLIPAHATEIAPPKVQPDEDPVWDGKQWIATKRPSPPPKNEPFEESSQQKINRQSRQYLAATDWYVVRFAETGTPIPDDIRAAREQARASVVE